jgi:hypothetical protein
MVSPQKAVTGATSIGRTLDTPTVDQPAAAPQSPSADRSTAMPELPRRTSSSSSAARQKRPLKESVFSAPIGGLPDELVGRIAAYLPTAQDVLNLALTNKAAAKALRDTLSVGEKKTLSVLLQARKMDSLESLRSLLGTAPTAATTAATTTAATTADHTTLRKLPPERWTGPLFAISENLVRIASSDLRMAVDEFRAVHAEWVESGKHVRDEAEPKELRLQKTKLVNFGRMLKSVENLKKDVEPEVVLQVLKSNLRFSKISLPTAKRAAAQPAASHQTAP